MQERQNEQNGHFGIRRTFSPSVGSRRLRPRLANFEFDAVDSAVNEVVHLL